MLARTILAGLIALSGAAHAACPTGADLSDGIVLSGESTPGYRVFLHHRQSAPDRVWSAFAFRANPPTGFKTNTRVLDRGLLPLQVRQIYRNKQGRDDTYDGDLALLDNPQDGASRHLTGTRTLIDTGEVLDLELDVEIGGAERVEIGPCSYDSIAVDLSWKVIKSDGRVFPSKKSYRWIPELQLRIGRSQSGLDTIRKRQPDDWFGDG